MLLACGLFVLGIEGCAIVEVAQGRARVTSVWFWIALTVIGLYLSLTGLEILVIRSRRLGRILYRMIMVVGPMARTGRAASLPRPEAESLQERLRWNRFWSRFRFGRRKR